jgi:enoyl-CoA hydratase
MESNEVLFTREDGIARIVVNRPEKRNALNIATRIRLLEVLETVREDTTLRVLTITGAGEESFISGGDLNELKDLNSIEVLRYLEGYSQKLYTAFERLPIPTVAIIKGYCLGGGCELALACDLRIAMVNAKLGLPELKHGVIPGGGGTQRLVRIIGIGRAKELILTGRIIDAEEAERIGLVSNVVPKDQMDAHMEKVARQISSLGPIAVRMAKAVLNDSMQASLDMGMRIEALAEAVCYSTEDKKEGFYAFLEKRKPHFKNE